MITVKHMGETLEKPGLGVSGEYSRSEYEVIGVMGLIPNLAYSNRHSGRKWGKLIKKGVKITEKELSALELKGVMVEYINDYID